MEGAETIWMKLHSLGQDLPAFVLPLALVLAAVLCAVAVHWALFRLIVRAVPSGMPIVASLVRQARRPLRLSLVLTALVLVIPSIQLPAGWAGALQHLVLLMLIVLIGWTAILLVNHFTQRSIGRYRIDAEDNFVARKFVTQARVLRRISNILIGIVTVVIALLTFDGVQEYGTSLFASAGAAGLILGLAARPVLGNLIAGVQIAITQPIKLEDVVIVEDEWGWVEEIFATYVVVRLWDWRRMVVPLSYFIENPFQNWTREQGNVIGAVEWQVDYTMPVERMREKLEELVKASDNWDKNVINLQVTDAFGDGMKIRGLMSARTSPRAWDLRCEVREKMISWLQQEYPEALPRIRMEFRGFEKGSSAKADNSSPSS